MKSPGTLYIVATPIGNLQDISARALHVLQTVDWIAAEDTRHSAHLLQHFHIGTPMLSLHAHNEAQRSQELLALLEEGKHIALISDAGTPLISDPGYVLVAQLQEKGIAIVPIPGACALIAALSVAGLPTEKFIFEGFLPSKSSHRRRHLETLKHEVRTLIFYEAPHRILSSLADFIEVFGKERQAVLAREMTKTYETLYRGSLNTVNQALEANPQQQKGEFVLLLHGAEPRVETDKEQETARILGILLAELPSKQAVQLAAHITGERKNKLYAAALDTRYNAPES